MLAAMKSAYELAMERLNKASPAEKPLTAEKKARLAEIDRLYKGKLAEREIFREAAAQPRLCGTEGRRHREDPTAIDQ